MEEMNIKFLNQNVNGVFEATADIASFNMYGIPRNNIQQAINNLPEGLQGIYFLVNNNESREGKRYLYIGQTKQGPKRLIDHKAKKIEWNMAYMFLADSKHMSLQSADELEAYEIERFSDSELYTIKNERPNKATVSNKAKLISQKIEECMAFFGYGFKEQIKIKNDENVFNDNKSSKSKLNLKDIGIYPGDILEFSRNSDIKVEVVNEHDVLYKGQITSLSSLATKLLNSKWGVRGTQYFTFKGELLTEIRNRLESK